MRVNKKGGKPAVATGPCGDGIHDVRFIACLAPRGAEADAVNRVATEVGNTNGIDSSAYQVGTKCGKGALTCQHSLVLRS